MPQTLKKFGKTDLAFFKCPACATRMRAYIGYQEGIDPNIPVMRDDPKCPHCGRPIEASMEMRVDFKNKKKIRELAEQDQNLFEQMFPIVE